MLLLIVFTISTMALSVTARCLKILLPTAAPPNPQAPPESVLGFPPKGRGLTGALGRETEIEKMSCNKIDTKVVSLGGSEQITF